MESLGLESLFDLGLDSLEVGASRYLLGLLRFLRLQCSSGACGACSSRRLLGYGGRLEVLGSSVDGGYLGGCLWLGFDSSEAILTSCGGRSVLVFISVFGGDAFLFVLVVGMGQLRGDYLGELLELLSAVVVATKHCREETGLVLDRSALADQVKASDLLFLASETIVQVNRGSRR